jgi:hypothetical protein
MMSTARNINPIETSMCNTARTLTEYGDEEIEFISSFKRGVNESAKKGSAYKNKNRNRKTCIRQSSAKKDYPKTK